jgi:hypothetical protein
MCLTGIGPRSALKSPAKPPDLPPVDPAEGPSEGRLQMGRILTTLAMLAALVLGGGAGTTGF